jgi:DNA gyrase/topoisomerase IV, subunit A
MGQRSGVGLVELAILEALDARRARPRGRAVSCEKVLAALEDEIGLARGYAYQVLIDLAQPWKLPLPLIEGNGNLGSRGNDPPASPRYTEARLSPVGQVALAAERGQIAPVPIGMINGNAHRDGLRPPFRPAAVIDAIRRVLLKPRLTGSWITGIVGEPDFITGCTVTGDLAALAAGQHAELGLHARVAVTDAAHVRDRVIKAAVPGHRPPGFTSDPGRPVIVVDKFPPYANTDDAGVSIARRAEEYSWHARHPELGALTGLPITNVCDLTAGADYWWACLPADGTPPEVLRDQILKVHGVSIYITTRLPRPLPTMIRTWVRACQHEDLPGSLTALETALASRQQRRLTATS